MKNYDQFLNESKETLLKDIPGLTTEEVNKAKEYAYFSAEQLYSVMIITPSLKDNLKETLNIDDNRYDEILEILSYSLEPNVKVRIDNFIPKKYPMGAIDPKTIVSKDDNS